MHATKVKRIKENDYIPRNARRYLYNWCQICYKKVDIFNLYKIGIVWNNCNKLVYMQDIYEDLEKDPSIAKNMCNRCLMKLYKKYIDKYMPYYTCNANKIIKWWRKVKYNPNSPYAKAHIIVSSLIHNFKLENYKISAYLLKYKIYHVIKNIMKNIYHFDKKQDIIRDMLFHPSKNITLMHLIKYANIDVGSIKITCKSLVDLGIFAEYITMSSEIIRSVVIDKTSIESENTNLSSTNLSSTNLSNAEVSSTNLLNTEVSYIGLKALESID